MNTRPWDSGGGANGQDLREEAGAAERHGDRKDHLHDRRRSDQVDPRPTRLALIRLQGLLPERA